MKKTLCLLLFFACLYVTVNEWVQMTYNEDNLEDLLADNAFDSVLEYGSNNITSDISVPSESHTEDASATASDISVPSESHTEDASATTSDISVPSESHTEDASATTSDIELIDDIAMVLFEELPFDDSPSIIPPQASLSLAQESANAPQLDDSSAITPFNESEAIAQSYGPKHSKPKTKKSHKKLWISLAIIGGVLLTIYVGFAVFFMFHFGFNTVINGADCSFKPVVQVEEIVADQIDSYQLKIIEREDKIEYISGDKIDLCYVSDDKVRTLLNNQNEFLWFMRLIQSPGADTLHATVSYDEELLKQVIDELACMNQATMIAPVDAYPEFTGALYSAHPEELGTTINTAVIYEELGIAINDTKESISLEEETCYVLPRLTSESQELLDIIDAYNSYVPFAITYTIGDTTEVLDGATTLQWVDKSIATPTLDQSAIEAWVADFAARYDTVGTTREFTSVDGATYTVEGGTYGWKIDQEAEVEAIMEAFNSKQGQTREPYYSSTAASHAPQDWGTTYIELNLATQHMYYVQDGKNIFEADVVTGLPTAKRITVDGVWDILEMQRNKVLRGDRRADGTYEYESPVSYWMRVTWTGIGFHDATWQSSFGGNRYTYAGSHGCINMSYSNARELYSLISTGTPVVSHY